MRIVVGSLKDDARLSEEYPVNTTKGLPAFGTEVASPTTSKPAEARCWLTSSPIINSFSTTSTRALTTGLSNSCSMAPIRL